MTTRKLLDHRNGDNAQRVSSGRTRLRILLALLTRCALSPWRWPKSFRAVMTSCPLCRVSVPWLATTQRRRDGSLTLYWRPAAVKSYLSRNAGPWRSWDTVRVGAARCQFSAFQRVVGGLAGQGERAHTGSAPLASVVRTVTRSGPR